MDNSSILDLWRSALMTVATVAGPFVLAALALGLITSILQAATQLQENMLSFVPKVAAVGAILALAGHQILGILVRFATEVSEVMVRVGASGR
jgi:flagellar biosynthetic protein FliQ